MLCSGGFVCCMEEDVYDVWIWTCILCGGGYVCYVEEDVFNSSRLSTWRSGGVTGGNLLLRYYFSLGTGFLTGSSLLDLLSSSILLQKWAEHISAILAGLVSTTSFGLRRLLAEVQEDCPRMFYANLHAFLGLCSRDSSWFLPCFLSTLILYFTALAVYLNTW